MRNRLIKHLGAAFFGLALIAPSSNATIITSTLGSDPGTSGFADGQILSVFPDLIGLPTLMAYDTNTNGSDPIENYDSTWTHSFGAITDTIVSATLTLGIYDHDSASAGSQLGAFGLDGTDFTAALDGLFEGSGGANNEYNVYSIALGAGFLGQLLDGTLSAALALSGTVESPGLLPTFPDQIDSFNGAQLIFSSLTIETRDASQPPGPDPIPEPGALSLLLAGLGILIARRKTV